MGDSEIPQRTRLNEAWKKEGSAFLNELAKAWELIFEDKDLLWIFACAFFELAERRHVSFTPSDPTVLAACTAYRKIKSEGSVDCESLISLFREKIKERCPEMYQRMGDNFADMYLTRSLYPDYESWYKAEGDQFRKINFPDIPDPKTNLEAFLKDPKHFFKLKSLTVDAMRPEGKPGPHKGAAKPKGSGRAPRNDDEARSALELKKSGLNLRKITKKMLNTTQPTEAQKKRISRLIELGKKLSK